MAEYNPQEHFTLMNIATILDEGVVREMGIELKKLIDEDDKSRQGWLDQNAEYLKLASQIKEAKNTPWPGASNVKFPLLTNACLQFHARALPALVNTSRPVKPKVIGKDADGSKLRRGMRISSYMSYQILEEMDEWVDELDRLLFILPMIGLCYKKTYYSPSLRRARSVLLTPEDVIVNYEAKDYERARMTEIIEMSPNEYIEMVREDLFLDVELPDPRQEDERHQARDAAKKLSKPTINVDTPYVFYESHCWYDLDGDGYQEPYVVTMLKDTGEIVRITPRWEEQNLVVNDRNEVVKIKAENFFTPWTFFPDPYSSVYGIGFGTLLGPNNEAINTLINQLIDAGTKANLGGGFIGRGARLKGGAVRLLPGEYKMVNSAGDDIRKSIVPLPANQPAPALFSLLQLLITVGDQTGSITDMIKGENPGQNQKVGTTMAVLEQGMKVYTSIYRRLHRALTKEYKQLFNLNRQYLDEDSYLSILDEVPSDEQLEAQLQAQGATEEQAAQARQVVEEMRNASLEDFTEEGVDIIPASEPSMISDTLQLMKSQSLMEKLGVLPLNVKEVTRRVLEAEQHQDIDELMNVPPQAPSVEERELMLDLIKEKREGVNSFFDNILKVAQAEAAEKGNQVNAYKAVVDGINKQEDRNQRERVTIGQNQSPTG